MKLFHILFFRLAIGRIIVSSFFSAADNVSMKGSRVSRACTHRESNVPFIAGPKDPKSYWGVVLHAPIVRQARKNRTPTRPARLTRALNADQREEEKLGSKIIGHYFFCAYTKAQRGGKYGASSHSTTAVTVCVILLDFVEKR